VEAVGEQGAAGAEAGAAAAAAELVAEAEEAAPPTIITRWRPLTGGTETGTAVEGGTAAGEVSAAAKAAVLAAAGAAIEAEGAGEAVGDKRSGCHRSSLHNNLPPPPSIHFSPLNPILLFFLTSFFNCFTSPKLL
jgi:hypothetical protein